MANILPVIDSLWNFDDPKGSEEKFLALLNDNSIEKDDCFISELLTQIARSQGLQRKFDEAHCTLDKSKEIIKSECITSRARYLLERGRVFNSSKNSEKARTLFLEAYKFSLKNNLDFYAIDAAHMMGILEKDKESLQWNAIAIKLAEESKVNRARNWLGSLYNNTAWTYHDMGNFDEALSLFERNVKWHEDRKSKKELIIAKWSVGRTYRSLGRVEDALILQISLIDELKEMKLEQDGYVFEEIGECLLLLKREDESKPYFKSAYELLSKDIWMQEKEKERLERLKKLGEL